MQKFVCETGVVEDGDEYYLTSLGNELLTSDSYHNVVERADLEGKLS
jgi:hypothetical protein